MIFPCCLEGAEAEAENLLILAALMAKFLRHPSFDELDSSMVADTTKASKFYIECNRKATPMRFASAWFDTHKDELQAISDYGTLLGYLDSAGLEDSFLSYARTKASVKE